MTPRPQRKTRMRGEMPLSGKVAIVTGASRGIGKAYCQALAAAGARVVAAARSETPGRLPGTIHETAELVRRQGGEAEAIPCDLADPEEPVALVRRTVERFGRVDIVVNNAARIEHRAVAEISARSWDASFAVNVRAPFLIMQVAAPIMAAQGGGSVVNLDSGAARQNTGTPGIAGKQLMYATTKAALARLTTYLAQEFQPSGIAVNSLSPGGVITELLDNLIPAEQRARGGIWKPCTPEAVGPPLVWLVQQAASAFSGRLLHADAFGVDWGPGISDREG
jgi:NAD(P)-dependent dehydrogenase (short-subunit alcohol dehydrogenase family)